MNKEENTIINPEETAKGPKSQVQTKSTERNLRRS